MDDLKVALFYRVAVANRVLLKISIIFDNKLKTASVLFHDLMRQATAKTVVFQ
jgi:hypothetical protein